MEPYPIEKAYRVIEPGPVILITTQPPAPAKTGRRTKRRRVDADTAEDAGDDAEDADTPRPNVMTCGFHMVVQHADPPLLAVCVGPWDASFETLKATRECVVAVPPVALAARVVDIGNCSGAEVDKFARFGLTAREGEEVRAPLVEKCLYNLECRVKDASMVKKFNMWVLEVVAAWASEDREGEERRMFHHRGDGTFVVDGEVLDMKEKMVLWKEYQD